MTDSNRILLSTTEIAKLAGVDVSTVSNWRRRFDGSFPEPVVTDDAGKRPKFNQKDIVEWLAQNSQVGTRSGGGVRISIDAMDELRGIVTIDSAIDVVGAILVRIAHERRQGRRSSHLPAEQIRQPGEVNLETPAFRPGLFEARGWSQIADPVLEEIYSRLTTVDDLLGSYDQLLASQRNRLNASAEQTTPDAFAAFLVALTDENRSGIVLDPAAGYGGVLLSALRQGRGIEGVGVEIDTEAAKIAGRRLFLGDVDAEIMVGESLFADPARTIEADLVICDPPLGSSHKQFSELSSGILWDFGTPPNASADTAWLQHAVAHLKSNGRAIVVTALDTLSSPDRASSQIRREMVRRGAVLAIFALPARIRTDTSKRLAVWVLGTPDRANRRNSVLLVDGGQRNIAELGSNMDLVDVYRAWLKDEAAALDSTVAASVPVTELLAPDATLLPSRWTQNPIEQKTARDWIREASSAYETAQTAFRHVGTFPSIALGEATSHWPATALEVLQKSGRITLIRGRHAERVTDKTVRAFPVLTVKHVRSGANLESLPTELTPQVDVTAAQLVEPGDVIVYLDRDIISARIWHESGWVLGRFMQLIRINDASLNSRYLAAAIANPANQRLLIENAIRTHFDLRAFEIVLPPREIQEEEGLMLSLLDQMSSQLHEAKLRLDTARLQISNAITSGKTTASLDQ